MFLEVSMNKEFFYEHTFVIYPLMLIVYCNYEPTINFFVLYTIPMNINGYVPFLINMLDTIVRGWKYANKVVITSSGYLLHAAGKSIVIYYKDFHFIFNLCFHYFLFSNLLLGYENLQATGHMSSTSTIKTSLWDQWWWFFFFIHKKYFCVCIYIYIYIYIYVKTSFT